MLTSLLLAAGESRRMGTPKSFLTLPGGDTFLSEAVAALTTEAISFSVAVASPALANAPGAPLAPFSLVVQNPDPQLGQLHSVQLGLRALAEKAPAASGVLIQIVDNPGFLAERVAILLGHLACHGAASVVIASFRGEPGHPLWLPRSMWPGVLAWTGPDGLQGFIGQTGLPVALVETDIEATTRDVDTPEAYREFLHPSPD